MLSTLQRVSAFVTQRRPATLLATKLTLAKLRPCTSTGWSPLLPKHYSSAPPKQTRRRWTDAEVQQLIKYVEADRSSPSGRIHWESISNFVGHPTNACKGKYNELRETDSLPESAKKDLKAVAKMISDSTKKARLSFRRWSDDEVARLRKAVSETKTEKISWIRVAEHVGNGRTKEQCHSRWHSLRAKEELQAIARKNHSDSEADHIDNATLVCLAGIWTIDEMAKLKGLFDVPKASGRDSRLNAAYAMFPHKSRIQIKYKLGVVGKEVFRKWERARKRDAQPKIQQMVSNYGGVEKTDWEAISKAVGLRVYRCQIIYSEISRSKHGRTYWTSDEVDRLVAALRSQWNKGISLYDWGAVAVSVETRTASQCKGKFHKNTHFRKLAEQVFPPQVSNPSNR